jgi:phosphonate transport system ATP-binding protein
VQLAFDSVGVRYPGADTPAVAGVSFSVAPGERVGLLGSSGSGKTTLLNVAAGLVMPTTGVATRDGIPLDSLAGSARRKSDIQVGMVHQQLSLVGSLKVIHNVNAGALGTWSFGRAIRSLWFGGLDAESAKTALARLGIADKLSARTSELSGGQQQRVALARVLRQCPELLLADEPVSAVDPAWSTEVLTVLTEEVTGRNASLLVSLHDVELALQFCDRLVGLRHGRVVFDLPTTDVSRVQLASLYVLDRALDGNTPDGNTPDLHTTVVG